MKTLMIEFARVGLLITMLMFSVQANERAKRIVRERRLPRNQESSPVGERSCDAETLLKTCATNAMGTVSASYRAPEDN